MRLKEGTFFGNKEAKSFNSDKALWHVESFGHSTGKI